MTNRTQSLARALPAAFLLAAVWLLVPMGKAQSGAVAVGASYNYTHTNLLPGCNCFGMQGGSGELQFGLTDRLAALGEVGVTHRGNLSPDGYALTQSTFTVGLRYLPLRRVVRPFGDLLLGTAHAGATLSPARNGFGDSEAFAFQTGGGVLVPLGRRWELKPAQLDYLLTTFANGANDRQNDLRFSAGVLFRLRR